MLALLGATAVSCGIGFIVYIIGGGEVTIAGIVLTIVMDCQGSIEEARWLGPLLAGWAEAPIIRGFGCGFEEADGKELPSLDE